MNTPLLVLNALRRSGFIVLVCVLALTISPKVVAEEASSEGGTSGVLRVRLADASRKGTDISLRFTVTDGKVDEKVYGFAMFWNEQGIRDNAFNYRIHKGRVVEQVRNQTGWKILVDMRIESDPWVKGGPARYELLLREEGESVVGQYRGSFHAQGKNPRKAQGAVNGTAGASVARMIPGHIPFKAEEHPRILVRKADLPRLRKLIN